jgi:hypothetical protein
MNPQGANQTEAEPPFDISEPRQSPALRRFNFLFVYFPVALAATATLSIIVWLIILGFNSEDNVVRHSLSALADIVFVVFFIPAVAICGLLPIALLALGIQIRRREISMSRSMIRTGQRLRGAMAAIDLRLSTASRTIIRPLIYLHGVGMFVRTLVKAVSKKFERS